MIAKQKSVFKEGRIIKAMSGFYYVLCEPDCASYTCRARGILRKEKVSPLVGDKVYFTVTDLEKREGVVENVLPRKNFLVRPPIANISQALLVFAVKNPDPNFSLIDRFIVLAEKEGLKVALCLTKTDLDPQKHFETWAGRYERVGYNVYRLSQDSEQALLGLRHQIESEQSVLAGPSGSGKSSLLNRLVPGADLKTGSISERLGRGRHTTRFTQLLPAGKSALVADTPGFSSLSLGDIPIQELKEYFIEFHEYDHDCKYGYSCLHEQEPGCQVRQAQDEGAISAERYQSYLSLLAEIRQESKRRY